MIKNIHSSKEKKKSRHRFGKSYIYLGKAKKKKTLKTHINKTNNNKNG